MQTNLKLTFNFFSFLLKGVVPVRFGTTILLPFIFRKKTNIEVAPLTPEGE